MKSENAFSGNQITTTMPIRKQDEKLRSYINNALKARYNKSRITGKTKRAYRTCIVQKLDLNCAQYI